MLTKQQQKDIRSLIITDVNAPLKPIPVWMKARIRKATNERRPQR